MGLYQQHSLRRQTQFTEGMLQLVRPIDYFGMHGSKTVLQAVKALQRISKIIDNLQRKSKSRNTVVFNYSLCARHSAT